MARHLRSRISQLTGADTAASDDVTGAADKGGDWVLEYQSKNSWIDTKALSAKDYGYRLATITVTNNSDSATGSLRDAIATAANAGTHPGDDEIVFSGVTSSIQLSSELSISDSTGKVTITGPGADKLTVSGNSASRVFNISG
ncbi:MAG: DUF4347 domain-containing protein, partial [Desulfobacteraceae bacterium]|nr:DUF4347 domain-containing protein [Desulfobacteraceae bacterium]